MTMVLESSTLMIIIFESYFTRIDVVNPDSVQSTDIVSCVRRYAVVKEFSTSSESR